MKDIKSQEWGLVELFPPAIRDLRFTKSALLRDAATCEWNTETLAAKGKPHGATLTLASTL